MHIYFSKTKTIVTIYLPLLSVDLVRVNIYTTDVLIEEDSSDSIPTFVKCYVCIILGKYKKWMFKLLILFILLSNILVVFTLTELLLLTILI